jgi:iron complex outermembrane receptor protein
MIRRKLVVRAARAALTTSLALGAVAAIAQEAAQPAAPQDEAGLEVITVTATRRSATDVQTTPVAVTALNDEVVDGLASNDLGDIASLVPNFSAGKPAGFNAAAFAIRGVGQTSIIVYADAHVGVAVDDFVIPHIQTQALDLFDIEQVEVLRGPQGTLFGKNTTGGMVNVRTKRPVLGEWGLDFQQKIASFGRFEERFAANVPLGEMFALRAAGAFINSDGFYENGASFGPVAPICAPPVGGPPPLPPCPALPFPFTGATGSGNGKDVGGDDVFSGRIKLLFERNEDLSAQFTYEMIRDDSDSPPSVNNTPPGAALTWNFLGLTRDAGNPIKHAATTNRDSALLNMSKGHRVDVNGYYLNLDWSFGEFTLHSVTGYREQKSRLPSTYTGEVGPVSLFDATRDDDRDTFQQELRLDGGYSLFGLESDFVAGFFYQNDDTDFCVLQVLGFLDLFQYDQLLGGLKWNDNPQVLCNRQRAENWALFADTTINLTDRLALSGGFRWTTERKRWAGRNQVFIFALDGNPTQAELGKPLNAIDFDRFPTGVVRDREKWGEPTGRATVSYQLTEGVFTYLTYSHGFKSGAYNDQTGTSGNPITPAVAAPTDPEIADSGEIGVKLDLFDNRLRLNAAGFYVRYANAQRDLVATFTNSFGATFQETRFFNAAEVRAGGIELELNALLTDWLELRGNFGWIESKYTRFEADTDFDGDTDIDLSNRDVNRSVPLQTAWDLVAHHDLGPGRMQYALGVDWEDEAPFVYSGPDLLLNSDPSRDGITDRRTLLNASLTFTDAADRYFVRVYGHNLTDKVYRVGELPVAALWTMSYYGEPRAFGVEFGFKLRSE